jgi:hypothetical protein
VDRDAFELRAGVAQPRLHGVDEAPPEPRLNGDETVDEGLPLVHSMNITVHEVSFANRRCRHDMPAAAQASGWRAPVAALSIYCNSPTAKRSCSGHRRKTRDRMTTLRRGLPWLNWT